LQKKQGGAIAKLKKRMQQDKTKKNHNESKHQPSGGVRRGKSRFCRLGVEGRRTNEIKSKIKRREKKKRGEGKSKGDCFTDAPMRDTTPGAKTNADFAEERNDGTSWITQGVGGGWCGQGLLRKGEGKNNRGQECGGAPRRMGKRQKKLGGKERPVSCSSKETTKTK